MGESLESPVGKSGVNHRLRKLSILAEELREKACGAGMAVRPFRAMRRRIMVRKTITIELKSGLEARPVAMLVQVASQYDSSIYVECDSKRVNAKSIME